MWTAAPLNPPHPPKKETSNERLHEAQRSEQMHPYVAKLCTVGYLD